MFVVFVHCVVRSWTAKRLQWLLGDSYGQISLCPAILSESRATRKLRALRRISTEKR